LESLPGEVATWLLNQGPLGFTTLMGFALYVYERYARQKDREAYDTALKAAQAEHIETLKTVTPLAQKFTDTMDVILPLAMAQLNRRSE